MKAKSWQDINVYQWQQLCHVFADMSNSSLDMVVKSAAIVLNKTEHEIDSLPIGELNKIAKQLAFTHEEVKPKAVRWIDVNGKRYRCIYDVRNIPAARYIESKVFGENPNDNLHRIAASMVIPQKRLYGIGFHVDDKYDASKHEEYANDMLSAPITEVLGSVVFFCEIYLRSIKSLRTYLVAAMLRTGAMTMAQAEARYQDLCSGLGGIIKPNWLHDYTELN